jgi:hypothetical protein
MVSGKLGLVSISHVIEGDKSESSGFFVVHVSHYSDRVNRTEFNVEVVEHFFRNLIFEISNIESGHIAFARGNWVCWEIHTIWLDLHHFCRIL